MDIKSLIEDLAGKLSDLFTIWFNCDSKEAWCFVRVDDREIF